jgi:hypothetical protein
MSAPLLLSDKSGFLEDIDELLNFAMNEGDKNRMARLDSARNDIRFFTYEESIKRILRIIENK